MVLSQAENASAASLARRGLSVFFLSGLLLSFPGAILPAWGHHIRFDYLTVSGYFLCLAAGIVLAVRAAEPLLEKHGNMRVLILGCCLAFGGLAFLSACSPPVSDVWRMGGLLIVGASAGLLNTAAFHAITPLYEHDSAATVNLAGVIFGLGCLVTALLVAGVYYVYTVGSIIFVLAVIPAFFALRYARTRFADTPIPKPPALRQVLAEFRSPASVLFASLLFFQFGNEWALAGWLPLFLIQRLGISPETSIMMLALYWLALLLGRLGAQAIMSRVSHAKLLMGSVLAALFGCSILTFTNNLFGAATAILFVGGGFASIYPLMVEKIGNRFPYYHPGFFNGIFCLAFLGGMLAPAALGVIASFAGVQVVMALPLLGTCMVFVLLVLIWIESKLSIHKAAKAE